MRLEGPSVEGAAALGPRAPRYPRCPHLPSLLVDSAGNAPDKTRAPRQPRVGELSRRELLISRGRRRNGASVRNTRHGGVSAVVRSEALAKGDRRVSHGPVSSYSALVINCPGRCRGPTGRSRGSRRSTCAPGDRSPFPPCPAGLGPRPAAGGFRFVLFCGLLSYETLVPKHTKVAERGVGATGATVAAAACGNSYSMNLRSAALLLGPRRERRPG